MTNQEDQALGPILRRLLEAGSTTCLKVEEVEYLNELASISGKRASLEGKRPLWHWIREGFYSAPRAIQQSFLEDVDEYVGELVEAAGEATPPPTMAGMLLAPLSKRQLFEAASNGLSQRRSIFFIKKVAHVAAFAGFHQLIPELVEVIDSEESLLSLVREECLEALYLLGYKDLGPLLPRCPDRANSHIRILHALQDQEGLCLAEIDAALPLGEWNCELVSSYPDLPKAFGRAGGALDDAFLSLQGRAQLPWGVLCWDAFAQAVLDRRDPILLDRIVKKAESAENEALLIALCMEAGIESAEWALPVFEGLWEDLRAQSAISFPDPWRKRPEVPETKPWVDRISSPGSVVGVAWVVGVLRGEDPAEFADREVKDLGAELWGVAIGLLSLSRGVSNDLLTELEETGNETVKWQIGVVIELLAGRGLSALQLILEEESLANPHLYEWVYMLHRAHVASGTPSPALTEAMEILTEGLFGRRSGSMLETGEEGATIWARAAVRRGFSGNELIPILRRISLLPEEKAVGPLEVSLLGSFSDLGLISAEMGCLEEAGGAFAKTVIRLLAHSRPQVPQLSPMETAVALALFSRDDLHDRDCSHLITLLKGSPLGDPILAAWAYSGRMNRGYPFRHRGIEPNLELLLQGIAGADDLSGLILARRDETAGLEKARRLLASPAGAIRARAAGLIFKAGEDPEEAGPYRRLLCSDPDPLVQVEVLRRIGSAPFSEEELFSLVSRASRAQGSDVKRALARALGKIRNPALLPVLFKMAREEYSWRFPEAARKAIGEVVDHQGLELIQLSVADPREVMARYLLSSPIRTPSINGDDKAEAMALLLQALEERAEEEKATAAFGRRVLISPVPGWPMPAPAGPRLKQAEFEALAVYLEVMFVDEKSGTVVAEVSDHQTGEVLNAIFETGETAFLTAEWG